MAQTHNNTAPHLNNDDSTFPSQSAPNSNPFTADLKGEFTSNFGTNTNAAVSQIFKDGSFGQENRTKYFLLGGLLLVLLAVGAMYLYPMLMGPDPAVMMPPPAVSKPEAVTQAPVAPVDSTSTTAVDEMASPESPATEASAPSAPSTEVVAEAQPAVPAVPATSTSTGPVSLSSPADGFQATYDETQSPLQFTWNGSGTIVFSRSASMRPAERRVTADGGYTYTHPMPGKWYWNVVSADGNATEVRSFVINPPVRRNIAITAPADGEAMSGAGATVSWQGDSNITYYRVELVGAESSDWGNPEYRFQTSGQTAQLKDVAPGQYKMRLGAFSQVSGRFEYTSPRAISIQ